MAECIHLHEILGDSGVVWGHCRRDTSIHMGNEGMRWGLFGAPHTQENNPHVYCTCVYNALYR